MKEYPENPSQNKREKVIHKNNHFAMRTQQIRLKIQKTPARRAASMTPQGVLPFSKRYYR